MGGLSFRVRTLSFRQQKANDEAGFLREKIEM
jgi:hypothetical protein